MIIDCDFTGVSKIIIVDSNGNIVPYVKRYNTLTREAVIYTDSGTLETVVLDKSVAILNGTIIV